MATAQRSTLLFDEVLDFLASSPAPEEIVAFQPSEALQSRMRYLLDGQRNGTLTAEEKDELDEMGRLNHFMSMLKIRARKKLTEA